MTAWLRPITFGSTMSTTQVRTCTSIHSNHGLSEYLQDGKRNRSVGIRSGQNTSRVIRQEHQGVNDTSYQSATSFDDPRTMPSGLRAAHWSARYPLQVMESLCDIISPTICHGKTGGLSCPIPGPLNFRAPQPEYPPMLLPSLHL